MNTSLVHTDVADGVFTLTLDAPDTGNALDVAMTNAVANALERANAMPDVHCVLIRSSGRHFCTGGNVKDMARGTDLMAGTAAEVQHRLRAGLHRITRALHGLEVPSVAAVNGAAVGAGFDLALMCDVRIAGQSARFAESFLRLGLVSGIGGAWFLTRIVGVAKAMELTLTSEFITAETAHELRIVSRVVPDEDLDQECLALAHTVAANPPQALRMAKRLVRESAESGLPAALEMAASMQAILLCGDEHRSRVQQFLAARN
ncbi:enoyl-CoA hydratase-related protein [Mycolicibacterium smegmatis]|jgi:enoyl-CoA hydratase/carnithine racemase|uniref:enoyl-CoA hydratase-related protein n=1 Tax=Mycolicibacterium smegmatis TaxID=1772 RepID=UPI001E3EDA22|nr:enoyl-CoA hydratase-related protein [Mycolicibacterium smegmatis]MCP2625521.1 enoyl-CoA hydratase-related protein [Mycolicibacterium smegmatis]MCP2626290.1 enoyl-CoA hydratase-related protein [Mycolicibacterium smegmatis]UGU29296.1 enoyl-CoA hydratase-related protein [Mycolicibacterium smegmatis]ULN70265.1 enoyl-CoA hydratase/isomerase family protein [Mycolicibacterium smegmatis]